MTVRAPLVVKLGGTTIAEERGVLSEVAEIARERPVVVVHGGGKRLTDWLSRLGIESRFQDGLRVTDDAALEVAVAVLRGVVNAELVAALVGLGARAVGLSGVDGRSLMGDRAAGLGRVVTDPAADPRLLETLLAESYLPVVAPLALDRDGAICNVNADDAAAALAAALGATFILLTDTDGVRGADGARIPELSPADAERLISEGVIAGGMVPKVRAASRAVAGPGTSALIAHGRAEGVLVGGLTGVDRGTRIRGSSHGAS